MRSELVFTNLTCNQACTYCTVRRPTEDRSFIVRSAVEKRIDQAINSGVSEITLSGGEPTMRNDLDALISYAKRNASSVVLETNGTLIDNERALRLAHAGLSLARINLSGWGTALDNITQDEGGFERTLVGINALLAAKIPIEFSVVITRSTRGIAGALPEKLAEHFQDLSLIKSITVRVPVESVATHELVTYTEAAQTLVAMEQASKRVGIVLKIAPDSGPPPCVFPNVSRVAHLYSLTPGARGRPNHDRIEQCTDCQLSDRCSGLARPYLQRFGPPPCTAIREDRVRRRLSLVTTTEEQIRREFIQENHFSDRITGNPIEEHLIRVNFHCNQACRFCFVSTHLPPAGDSAVQKAIIDAAKAGKQVTLTGGEPTLNANLVEYVKLAKQHSSLPIALQTNAIRLADSTLTEALVEAGLSWVQVSLHGSYAELCDAITEAPGTFEKQVVGIDNLHQHKAVYLAINFVITQRNYDNLVPFVKLCASRWPRAFVNISFVGATSDVVPREKALVPKYSDVLPHLLAAIHLAHELNIDIGGFESMCGIPLCLVPASDRYSVIPDIPPGYDGGEFLHPAACTQCDLRKKCYGIRRGYFELYGADELHPSQMSHPQLTLTTGRRY